MDDASKCMEYNFANLRKLRILEKQDAIGVFLYFFEIKKKYSMSYAAEVDDLDHILIHSNYLIINNEPRRKGKRVFFTGHAVEAKKEDLIDYIRQSVNNCNLIIPLFIIPVTERTQPEYMITTQEDPVFEIMKPN